VKEKFYIIAGNYKQAANWAKSWNLKNFIYIHSSHQLSGVRRNFKFARVGTWYENPNNKIEERIKLNEGIEVSDPSET
jgi:hypothetical protein